MLFNGVFDGISGLRALRSRVALDGGKLARKFYSQKRLSFLCDMINMEGAELTWNNLK